jgi:arylsulfatase A-like enzyme
VAAVIALCGCDALPPLTASNPVNVLVIVLDTVRADRLSAYGYDRPVSPNLDALAREGVRFDHFFSSSSWTLPAHASLFTGLHPAVHAATQEHLELSREHTTLSERFAAAGYATFGASSNGVVNKQSGLARGFATFVESFRQEVWERFVDGPHPNHGTLLEFLDERPQDRPFFAFLNYIDAHLPYKPPEPFRSRFLRTQPDAEDLEAAMRIRLKDHYLREDGLPAETLRILNDLYDGEIALLDSHIGKLIDDLRARGLLEETLVVVLSDHGENLGEHGHFSHVFSIHDTLLRVPLIVRFPGGARAGSLRQDAAALRDLYPTLLRYCGIALDSGPYGRDLFDPSALTGGNLAISEYYYPSQVLSIFTPEELESGTEQLARFRRRLRSIQDEHYKLVWSAPGRLSLFDMESDPGEQRDLSEAPGEAATLARLRAALVEELGELELPGAEVAPRGFEDGPADPELIDGLRALGYVE